MPTPNLRGRRYGARAVVIWFGEHRQRKTLEEGLDLRTVVIEVESVAAAVAAYESAAYQAAQKTLGDGAVRDIRIVEGLE